MILPREVKKCELYNCLYIASTGIKKKKAGHQGLLAITRASKLYLIKINQWKKKINQWDNKKQLLASNESALKINRPIEKRI